MLLFAYRLALALGEPCPEDMLDRMSATTLRRWLELYEIDPWGEERADLRAAIQGATIVSALSGKRQRVEDYMPKFRKQPQSLAEMERVMRQFAAATNRFFTHGDH